MVRITGFQFFKLYSVVILFFITANTFAQNIDKIKFNHLASENIKLEKGLSQNWIYNIWQDQYGYMWFGTWDGLNKYDGYNFTI